MDQERLLRINEINDLIKDGLLPYERMRILLEELLELRINYNLFNQPLKICKKCEQLKHACFFEKETKGYFEICKYCRLVKQELLRKRGTLHKCKICDVHLLIGRDVQKKWLIDKHNKTNRHQKNLKKKDSI